MSYTSKYMQKRGRRTTLGPRGRGMAGIAEIIEEFGAMLNGGVSQEAAENSACRAAANAKTAELDAKASDVSKNWNPTGIYSVAQMQAIVQSTMAMLLSASNTVDKASSEPIAPGARDALAIKRAAIQRKMSTEGLVFTGAIGKAMQSGIDVIDSPGFKTWVVNSMLVASDGISAAYFVSCQTPWWVGALAAFQAAFDKVWGVVKQVAGVAVELGQQVLKIPGALADVWKYATYGAAALIALWAWENVPKIAKGA